MRASDLPALVRFDVVDEDLAADDFVGACRASVASAFGGAEQTVNCPVDAATMNSGFTLRWHLEPF